MRLVFAGTPVFAQCALEALAQAGHEIALVLTRPDKPAARGHKLVASPVKQWATGRGLGSALYKPGMSAAEVGATAAAFADAWRAAASGGRP